MIRGLLLLLISLQACHKSQESASPLSASVQDTQLAADTQTNEEAALRLPPKFLMILPQEAKAQVGDRLPLSCLAEFPYSVRRDITTLVHWSVEAEDLAKIDSSGNLAVMAPGEVLVTADYRGVSTSRKVTLTERTVRQLLIFPQDLSLELPATVGRYESRSFVLEAYGLFSDGQLTDMSQQCQWVWTGGNGLSALEPKGKFRATAAGEYVFHVTCLNFSAERKVSVHYGTKKPKSLTIPEGPLVLSKGESHSFSVILTYSDGSVETVTQSAELSGGESLVSRQGAQLRAIGSGDAIILVRQSGLTAELPLHVSPARPTALRFQPTGFSLQIGTRFPVRVYADMSDGTAEEVTSGTSLRSLAEAHFRVPADSFSIEGVQAGTGQLEASYKGVTATAPVVVGAAVLDKLTVEPERLEVVAGLTTSYRVWGHLTDGQWIELTAVATAVPLSLSRAEVPAGQKGQVLGKTQGTTSLSVTYIDPDGRNLTTTAGLSVLPAQLVSMSLEPSESSVAMGRVQEFRVRGLYTDQSEQDLTEKVEVMANVQGPLYAPVARIFLTSSGRIRLQSTAVGAMELQVKMGSFTDSSTLTVTEKVLDDLYIQRLALSGPSGQISKGQSARFRAFAVFSDQTSEDVTTSGSGFTSTWTPPAAARADFADSNGDKLFTALSEGDAQFSLQYTGSRGTRSATFNIGVYTACSAPGHVDSYYCYYLGNVAESCTATCSAQGRLPHPATLEAIGSSGTSDACNRVLTNGFRSAMSNFNYAASAPAGIGCAIFTLSDLNLGIREGTRVTNDAASAADFRRVCACQ